MYMRQNLYFAMVVECMGSLKIIHDHTYAKLLFFNIEETGAKF